MEYTVEQIEALVKKAEIRPNPKLIESLMKNPTFVEALKIAEKTPLGEGRRHPKYGRK